MKRILLCAVSVSAVLFALSSLFSCKEPAPVGGGAGGQDYGDGGSSGVSNNDAAVGGRGGTTTAATWVLPDVIPAEPDAPEEAAAPSADSNCGSVASKTKRQPADVLLVLDRSASMDWSIAEGCYCDSANMAAGGGAQLCKDTTNCTTRWNAIKDARRRPSPTPPM